MRKPSLFKGKDSLWCLIIDGSHERCVTCRAWSQEDWCPGPALLLAVCPCDLEMTFPLVRSKCVMGVCSVAQSCLTLCDPMAVACQVPLSMGFYRQEYWSGFPVPPSEDLPDRGIKPESPVSPASLAWQADSLPLRHLGRPLRSKRPC